MEKKKLTFKNKITAIELYKEFAVFKALFLRECIIYHKQILWYFIILHIPVAVKLPMSLLLNRQLQVHLQNTRMPLHPQIKQKEKKTTNKHNKKNPHPQTFKILQQQKERKNNFTTYLHHLFTLQALKLNKYGFRKNNINKNKIIRFIIMQYHLYLFNLY